MATLQVDGIAVGYRESGSGVPVVLLHGGGSSGAQWRAVAERLAERYRPVTVDHYGHGGTDPWPGDPQARSHDAEAVLVRGVMEHVGTPVHLVGHSYGGGVALRLAVQPPGLLRSLVLLEPIALSLLSAPEDAALADGYRAFARSFQRDVAAGDVEGAWERFIDGNGAPGDWARLPEAARARMSAMTDSIDSAWNANLAHATVPEECRAIAVPTLLMHGAETKPHFRRIVEVLGGLVPGATQRALPEAGHMSPLTHPEPLAAALAEHLNAH